MSAFLSTVILLIGGFLFAVALVYWDKGGYANNVRALWWGVGSLVVVTCGVAFTFYNNVVEPSKRGAAAADGITPAFRLDQRAWVATIGANGKPEANKPTIVTVFIKNTGKTMAKNVRIQGGIRHVGDGTEPNFEQQVAAVKSTSVGVMPPAGDYFSTNSTGVVDAEGFGRIQSGQLRIYVFGKISYEDIFGAPHQVRFCYRLNPVNWVWEVYATYNDAD